MVCRMLSLNVWLAAYHVCSVCTAHGPAGTNLTGFFFALQMYSVYQTAVAFTCEIGEEQGPCIYLFYPLIPNRRDAS